ADRLKGCFTRTFHPDVISAARSLRIEDRKVCLLRLSTQSTVADVRCYADDLRVGLSIRPRAFTDAGPKRAAATEVSVDESFVDDRGRMTAFFFRLRVAFVEISPGDDPGAESIKESRADAVQMHVPVCGDSFRVLDGHRIVPT